MSRTHRIWTIQPGIPFLEAFADGLMALYPKDGLDLEDILIFLPTRRACRSLERAFLKLNGGGAVLLPRLFPLGEVEEDLLAEIDDGLPDLDPGSIPPAIPDTHRLILLSRLILEQHEKLPLAGLVSPSNAIRLARDLMRLIDQVQSEELSFDNFVELVPEDYADHWQVTLRFLTIITESWPQVLKSIGFIDPVARRNKLIYRLIKAWRAQPPAHPIFAAGSTGSVSATRDLLVAVAKLARGGVILPGLDTTLGSEEARGLEPSHPQFGMVQFLKRVNCVPNRVPFWQCEMSQTENSARFSLVSEAMLPVSGIPPEPFPLSEKALENVEMIECSNQAQEAGVIALALRQVLETPGKTAALITPDRTLARRVAAELDRWDIKINDSAGQPLSQTPPAVFLRLAAGVFSEDCTPIAILSLLKHPLSAAGEAPGLFRRNARRLELEVLRGPRPAPGLSGIMEALDERSGMESLKSWFGRFSDLAAHFAELMTKKDLLPTNDLVAAHIKFAEEMAATDLLTGRDRLWSGEAGNATASFVASLLYPPALDAIRPSDYCNFFDSLLEGQIFRSSYGTHPRLNIWGLLEARLQDADFVCLGGLNEGIWPSDPIADPWMSLQMRESFGLPSQNKRVGLSAHDFAQSFCAREVLVTRSQKVDGSPTVPSRWLLMLQARLKAGRQERGNSPKLPDHSKFSKLVSWQLGLDRPSLVAPVPPPSPCPPVEARPRRLSVTAIETWRRDPYSIFARHILGLRPLEEIDADPGAASRGTIIHEALDIFMRETAQNFPEDPLDFILSIGEKCFGKNLNRPGVKAFWWPRFVRIAEWFVENELLSRNRRTKVWTEVKGSLQIDAPAGPFTLTAQADRIELLSEGGLAIIDYKTGSKPTSSAIRQGYSPQLPLEAVIASAGGFREIPPSRVSDLEFWRLSGGRIAGAREGVNQDIEELARLAEAGIKNLVSSFDNQNTPYFSMPDVRWALSFPEYEHLARVAEWADGYKGFK